VRALPTAAPLPPLSKKRPHAPQAGGPARQGVQGPAAGPKDGHAVHHVARGGGGGGGTGDASPAPAPAQPAAGGHPLVAPPCKEDAAPARPARPHQLHPALSVQG